MSRRVTGYVKRIKDNEVFVFGSNLAGIHGKGAARQALNWGAVMGVAEGMSGATYAIPTKDKIVRKSLSLGAIKAGVERFIKHASENESKLFLVTEIGCGLAKFNPEDIAPLFSDTAGLDNVKLPKRFWDILNRNYNRSKL